MRFIFCAILSIILNSCGDINSDNIYPSPSRSDLVYEISNKVFKKLKNEKNLCRFECGSGKNPITFLHWGFLYYNDINVDEARELLIIAANQFLEAFNADERIRPYLANYPFKPENIEINIFLKKPNGSELEAEKLHVISIQNGILDYMIEIPEKHHLKTVLLETYEEASAKLTIK